MTSTSVGILTILRLNVETAPHIFKDIDSVFPCQPPDSGS